MEDNRGFQVRPKSTRRGASRGPGGPYRRGGRGKRRGRAKRPNLRFPGGRSRRHRAQADSVVFNLLVEIERALGSLPVGSLPRFLGDLEKIRAEALLRLVLDRQPSPESDGADELLNAQEAARRLGVSKDFLYRTQLPFKVRIGRRLRFSAKGIAHYIRLRRRAGAETT